MSAKFDSAWFKARLKEVEATQEDLADAIGKDRTIVSKIFGGKIKLQIGQVPAVAKVLRVDQSEVLRRAGLPIGEQMHATRSRPLGAQLDPLDRDSDRTLVSIPEVDVRAGMGGGGESLTVMDPDGEGNIVQADDVRAVWELPYAYIRGELGVRPSNIRLLEVRGDSMEPTLRSGDRVMVDVSDRMPSPPGVFAVWDGFGTVVKRLEHIMNSDPATLRIISDNPHHGPDERTAEEVNIVGRVIWYGRRM